MSHTEEKSASSKTINKTSNGHLYKEGNNLWVYQKALTTHRYLRDVLPQAAPSPTSHSAGSALRDLYQAKSYLQSKRDQTQQILNLDYTSNQELVIHSYKDVSLVLSKLKLSILPYEYTVKDFVIGVEPILYLVENKIAKPNFVLDILVDKYGIIQDSIKNNGSELTYELLYMIQLDALTHINGKDSLRTSIFVYYDTLIKDLTINVEELSIKKTVPVNFLSYEMYAMIELEYRHNR